MTGRRRSLLNILALLSNTKVVLVSNDKIIWLDDSKGKFIVKSF